MKKWGFAHKGIRLSTSALTDAGYTTPRLETTREAVELSGSGLSRPRQRERAPRSKFPELYSEHNPVPVFISPHSSHQVEPLDLCIFGVTQKLVGKLNNLQKMNVQNTHNV
jgi:hypothetical protein